MDNSRNNQQTLRSGDRSIFIPLYSTIILKPFEVSFGLPDSVQPITCHFRDKTITPVTIANADITIALFPFDSDVVEHVEYVKSRFPIDKLEHDYDRFHFNKATAGILASAVEYYPYDRGGGELLTGSGSPYLFDFIHSFLSALKLYDDNEPHYFRGYTANRGVLLNVTSEWPIKDMHGTRMTMDEDTFQSIISFSKKIRSLESTDWQSTGYRVFDLARGYFHFTATQSEFNIIFVVLMTAFEAPFKKSDENNVSRARIRFGKMIAQTREEYSVISSFMSEDPNTPGCCHFRNALVHGSISAKSINPDFYRKLRSYFRRALVEIVTLFYDGVLDKQDYYASLDSYVEKRFDALPNRDSCNEVG